MGMINGFIHFSVYVIGKIMIEFIQNYPWWVVWIITIPFVVFVYDILLYLC